MFRRVITVSRCFGLQVNLRSCQVFPASSWDSSKTCASEALRGSSAPWHCWLGREPSGRLSLPSDWPKRPSLKARVASAVRRQVKLAERGRKKKAQHNLLRVNFLERLSVIYERRPLTPGAKTTHDEEPQVSPEKARSNHRRELNAVVCLYWLNGALIAFDSLWLALISSD